MATLTGTRFLAVGVFVCCSLVFGALGSAEDAAKKDAQELVVVTGRVVDTDGKPIAGATGEWGNDKTPFQKRTRVKTSDDGTYKLALKSVEGHNWLAASAPDYTVRVATTQPEKNTCDFTLSAVSKDKHFIAGEVLDEHNKPIAGARVEVFTPLTGFNSSFSMTTGRDYFPGPDRVCTTDEQGLFRISDIHTDEVQLSVQARHRDYHEETYPVSQGITILISGSGEAGVVQGRVVDAATGLPPKDIAKVRIVLRYSTTNQNHPGEDGTFRIPREVALGNNYGVLVYAKGYAAATAQIPAVSAESTTFAKIELSPHPSLLGKLVDADTGQPIAGAPILYGVADGMRYMEWSSLSQYADGYHSLAYVQRTVSGTNGEFWFAEPKAGAKGTIIISAAGYQRLILHARNHQRDETTGEVLIRLRRESAFEGTVFIDGKATPNISVSLRGTTLEGVEQWYESVRTDATGKYRYGRLAPGNYRVHCEQYSREGKVGKGETATLNLGDDLGPLRIHGKVEPDVKINLSPRFRWDYTELSTKSNSKGEYEIGGLKEGRYEVFIFNTESSHLWHREYAITVKSDGQQIDLLPKSPTRTK